MRDHDAFWLIDGKPDTPKKSAAKPGAVALPDAELHTHLPTAIDHQVTHSHAGGDEPHTHGGPYNGDDIHCWRAGDGA